MHGIRIKGEGIPLLMLHGWGETHEGLIPLAELLTNEADPRLVDLPGFGRSKCPEGVWSADDYADSLIRYLDRERVEKIAVLGHSFGGKIAMCLAMRYPDRIMKLILIGASGIPPKRTFFKAIRRKAIVGMGKMVKLFDSLAGTRFFERFFISKFGSADYKNAGQMRSILVRSVNEDLTPRLQKIACPSLLLWGGKDTETPLESGERLSLLIRNSFFYSFSHHGHHLHADGVHLCAKYAAAFLRGGEGWPL